MKKKAQKFLIGTGIAAAGVGAVTAISYKLTKKLLNVAMDRELPKAVSAGRELISGSKELEDFANEVAAAAEKLSSGNCEEVETTAHDGIKLIGHWRQCPDAKRAIIAMHGWRSSWTNDFGTIADFWQDNGCSVLYAEQRSHGSSEGDYISFGMIERYDCLEWIKWVNEKTSGTLPVYLGGVSMGASTVLMAAGLELPENVRGIVADCGFTSPHAIWKHVLENNLHISYGGVRGAVANDLCKKKINMGAKDYSTIDAMHECKVPVMFIHGTDDKFVPVEMTYDNYKACTAPKRLIVVPGADHAMSYYTDKQGYENAIRLFWKDYDPTV